jgi:hypothetical protein
MNIMNRIVHSYSMCVLTWFTEGSTDRLYVATNAGEKKRHVLLYGLTNDLEWVRFPEQGGEEEVGVWASWFARR